MIIALKHIHDNLEMRICMPDTREIPWVDNREVDDLSDVPDARRLGSLTLSKLATRKLPESAEQAVQLSLCE